MMTRCRPGCWFDSEPDEYEVKLETQGDVLSMEGETPKVLSGARVSVLCSGTQKQGESREESECSSTLSVHSGRGKSAKLGAETDDAPGQSKFRADGGERESTIALDRGNQSCGDGASRDEVRGERPADRRAHEGVAEWNARTGSAPTYVRVSAQGGLCQNDLFAALRIEGGTAGNRCYRLIARTDRGQRSVDEASADEAIIQAGRGAYSSGSSVLFKAHKLCARPESVRFTLRYHL